MRQMPYRGDGYPIGRRSTRGARAAPRLSSEGGPLAQKPPDYGIRMKRITPRALTDPLSANGAPVMAVMTPRGRVSRSAEA